VFCALATTRGPTPGALARWHGGRGRYAVWLLRVADAAVRARQAAVADRLGPAIVPVAAGDVHVTAWVCGFPSARPRLADDVAEATLAAQRAAVRGVRPPRLLVGAPNAFATCAFLEVHDPDGELAALRRRLAAAPGAREVRFARYRPHVTVGRFPDDRPTAPLAAALAGLRADPRFHPIPAGVPTLELVELDSHDPDRFTTRWSVAGGTEAE
jgi:hypothetical protein